MSDYKKNRRIFIKNTIGATALASISSGFKIILPKKSYYNPKSIPTRPFGKTGVELPIYGLGTGSRFVLNANEEEGQMILNYALDNGLFFWDTANAYVRKGISSEERLGKVLKNRRKEVFLATKLRSRNTDEAKKQLEESLKRLQTDYLDILHLHMIKSPEDLKEAAKKGGVIEMAQKLKEEGVTRFIGFTGHNSAEAMKTAAENYNFDAMLISLDHHRKGEQMFEGEAIPAASKKGLGVMVMKVIRPRETVKEVTPAELIRYALSIKHVDSAVIGTDSLKVLKQNIEFVKNFNPMTDEEMDRLTAKLTPFYKNQHKHVEWHKPHYMDGYWT